MRYKQIVKSNELITRKQAVAYGMLAYYTIKSSANKNVSCKFFAEEIITIMELNSPVEVEERADKILEIDK